jgi:hypothetical protein
MTNDLENLKRFMEERDALFLDPTLENAQAYWKRQGFPKWEHPTVPLAMVHKARLHWLEATNKMLTESMSWLYDNGYASTMKGAPPLTPERRDADRVSLGKLPLGDLEWVGKPPQT